MGAASGGGLERDGPPPGEALPLATLIVSSMEGALVPSRAQRSTSPLERVADQLEALIRDSVRRTAARD